MPEFVKDEFDEFLDYNFDEIIDLGDPWSPARAPRSR